jgi:hypothetical protein
MLPEFSTVTVPPPAAYSLGLRSQDRASYDQAS